jgi:hypothetical protein
MPIWEWRAFIAGTKRGEFDLPDRLHPGLPGPGGQAGATPSEEHTPSTDETVLQPTWGLLWKYPVQTVNIHPSDRIKGFS